jgi:hypothetical protein
MQELATIVGRSPRETKRFVNIYRLLKAALAPAESDVFVRDTAGPGSFHLPMLLLAVATGMPVTAGALLRSISTGKNPSGRLMAALKRAVKKGSDDEQMRLDLFLRQGGSQPWTNVNGDDLKRWAGRISQFSFEAPIAFDQQ